MPHYTFFNPKLSTPIITRFKYSVYGNISASVTHSHSKNATPDELRKCIAGMERVLGQREKVDDLRSALFGDQMHSINAAAEEIALDTQRLTEIKLGLQRAPVSKSSYFKHEHKEEAQYYEPEQSVPSVTWYEYRYNSPSSIGAYHNHPKNPTGDDLPKIEACIAFMRTLIATIPHDPASETYRDVMVTINVIKKALEEDIRKRDELENQMSSLAM